MCARRAGLVYIISLKVEKIAHMAAASGVAVAPHRNQDIHSQLVAAIPNVPFIEYPVRTSSVKLFDELLENPVYPKDGFLAPRTGHGFDLVLGSGQLQRYRIG